MARFDGEYFYLKGPNLPGFDYVLPGKFDSCFSPVVDDEITKAKTIIKRHSLRA